MVVRLGLPERLARPAQKRVCPASSGALDPSGDCRHGHAWGPNDVDMIWHHYPRSQIVEIAFSFAGKQCGGEHTGDTRISKPLGATRAAIQLMIHSREHRAWARGAGGSACVSEPTEDCWPPSRRKNGRTQREGAGQTPSNEKPRAFRVNMRKPSPIGSHGPPPWQAKPPAPQAWCARRAVPLRPPAGTRWPVRRRGSRRRTPAVCRRTFWPSVRRCSRPRVVPASRSGRARQGSGRPGRSPRRR
jgi:hypothetical protein